MDAFVHCFYDIAVHQSELIKDVNFDIPPTHKYRKSKKYLKPCVPTHFSILFNICFSSCYTQKSAYS